MKEEEERKKSVTEMEMRCHIHIYSPVFYYDEREIKPFKDLVLAQEKKQRKKEQAVTRGTGTIAMWGEPVFVKGMKN